MAATVASRLRRIVRWFVSRYGIADPRTLGALRIAIGLLLCADCVRHWAVARIYYANDGVLTNHYLLFRPSSEFNFSLFSSFSSSAEVNAAFALSLTCYFLFAIGWHARLFNVLSCLWVTSLDNRLILVENGGYVVVNLVVFWMMFLPTGQRFSCDSWRRSWRERCEVSVADLATPFRPRWLEQPRASLASFLLFANLAIVYLFNVVNKFGDIWRRGETVHDVLHLDRMVTGVAVVLREHLPYRVLQLTSWATLIVEALIFVTIVWPTHRLLARPVAMALMFLLHTAFGVMMRLGPFSWFLIGWSIALLQRAHWDALARWFGRRARPITVALRPDSPLALRIGRVLSRLDRLERISVSSGETNGPLVEVRAGQSTLAGEHALWAIAKSLPGGSYWAPVVRFGSLGLASLSWRLALCHYAGLERFFGWRTEPAEEAPRSLWRWPAAVGRSWIWARELLLGYLAVCAAWEMLIENASIPPILHFRQPKIVRATINYPRIYQGWGMFAPNPVREDGILAVDGYTIDGRRVDPFTGKPPELDLSRARGLGLGQIEQDYANRIRMDRFRIYHAPLIEYLRRYPQRTGRRKDELVAFDVYWLRDNSPPPGSLAPSPTEKVCLISWRRPGPMPPRLGVPPQCKETSAEKKDE